MKKFSLLFMVGLVALCFGACSDDVNVLQDSNEEIADAVYMSFDLKLPSSRSATDEKGNTNSNATPDSEVGSAQENKVSTVKVVLATYDEAKKEYTYVAESADGFKLVGEDDVYTVTFQAADLAGILPEAGQTAPQVYAFVVCNPPTGFDAKNIFEGNGSVTTGDEELKSSIAQPNSFLMTNTEISVVPTIPVDLTSYNSPANPFDLGVVKVERTAARFDYKVGGTNSDNVYPVEGTNVSIKLTGMTLVNMSKNYWWLRHVADASATVVGQYNPETITLCGKETPRNYVVDTDHEAKFAGNAPATNFIYHVGMSNPINPTNFTYTDINSLKQEDNWTGAEGYKVWRYATENTLPKIDEQLKKYSTGVIFKGVIEETEETDEDQELLDGTSNVYVFGDVLYGNWTQVREAAEEQEEGALKNVSLNAAYKDAQASVTGNEEPNKAAAVDAGFTVYSPNTKGEYEVYYYYWNRHNDNGNNTDMGIMEFAVVRNNVYKLSVIEINRYGHPGDPTGDPDPEKPDDPDEDDEVYFRVGVKVLPWVVRVNDIEF